MKRILLMVLVTLLTFNTYSKEYTYDGGYFYSDTDVQRDDHQCLAMLVFLEARSEGSLSQILHGMTTLNRSKDERRWSNTVCGVLTDKHQFESVKGRERLAVTQLLNGDKEAIFKYITIYYPSAVDRKAWLDILELTYGLITTDELPDEWVSTDHFLVPYIMQSRGGLPSWYYRLELVMVASNTHFLTTKL